MENGILKRSLLSFKKVPVSGLTGEKPELTVLYKHYLLLFGSRAVEVGDCAVFDTQKGTVTNISTGLDLAKKEKYFLGHWKDNIFVFYGERQQSSLFGPVRSSEVYLLYIFQRDTGISFEKVLLDTSNSRCPYGVYPAHIYQDNMFIVIGDASHEVDMWRLDLNEKTWSEYIPAGEVPRARLNSTSVLFEDKIYLFAGNSTGGLFGGNQNLSDLSVLNLQNMVWNRIHKRDFLSFERPDLVKAEVVGENIYISSPEFSEFSLYNPKTGALQKSESVSPKEGYILKSYLNDFILFRITSEGYGSDKIIIIEYHSSDLEKTEKNGLTETSQMPSHMELLWKDKLFADITFVIQNEEILAHRNILIKSRYFLTMFQSGMMEANSDKINVPDISPTNFKAILEFIYCDKITLTETLALDLIILADMYSLAKLKADCETYLSTHLTTENFLNVLKAAETGDSQKVKDKVVSFLATNIKKVKQEVDICTIPHELLIETILYQQQNKK